MRLCGTTLARREHVRLPNRQPRPRPPGVRYRPRSHGGRDGTRVRTLHRRRAGRGVVRRRSRAERARDRRRARPRRNGRERGRRPRGRRCAGRPRGTVGEDPAERALAPAARARGRRAGEPEGARRARDPEHGEGTRQHEGRGGDRGRELPVLRVDHRHDRRPLAHDRRVAPLLLPEGAGRRLRPDRAVELPDHAGVLEALARARGGVLGRPQARPRDAAHCAPRWRSSRSRSAFRPVS